MNKGRHLIADVWIHTFRSLTYLDKFMVAKVPFILFFSFSSCGGATKYKSAYITKKGDHFVITLRGKGTGHPAGPGDILFPRTFEDSIELVVPISIDTISFNKVKELYPEDSNRVDTLVFSKGYIYLSKLGLVVDLYTSYPEYPPNDPIYWNGDYDLNWKK